MVKKRMLPTIIILISFSFLQMDCKDEPITPENKPDTTSHNFVVMRIDTLGDLFSFAHGVDIVDENNIWVAGMFTERDANGEILYNKNLAHWNGQKWMFVAVPMLGYNNTGPSIQELGALKVFNDSLIFVVAKHDNSIAWWNGAKWTSTYVTDATVSPIFWARSDKDIYFVAREGRATHFNGQTFTKINTGLTNPPLLDVWGDENAVYVVGEGRGGAEGSESIFLSGNFDQLNIFNKYVLNSANESNTNFLGGMKSIFRTSKSSKLWILGGWGNWKVYEVESVSPFKAKKHFEFPFDYPAVLIRGTSDSDLYIPSSLNSIFYHYNGVSWYRFDPSINNFLVFDFSVKKKTWVMVGSLRNSVGTATVITGEHQ